MSSPRWLAVVICFAGGLQPSLCRSAPRATVDKILEGPKTSVPESEHVRLQRGGIGWKTVRVHDELQWLDWLRVGSPAIVGVKIRADSSDVDLTSGDDHKSVGKLTTKTPESVWEYDSGHLNLLSGTLSILWLKKSIRVTAAGVQGAVSSASPARVAFNASADSAVVFVESGHVRFPQYPEVTLGAGEAARWKSNSVPEKFLIEPAVFSEFKHEMTTTEKTVWPTALWKRPIFIIPAAAVTTAAVYLITHQSKVTGTVTVIPG